MEIAKPRTEQKSARTTNETLPAPLLPHWAFVVQLRQGTPLTPEALTGRVEHIVTGQATLFASLDELLSFMQQVLSHPTNR